VRPFASIDEWIMRRPWEAFRVAMQEELADFSWTELLFGTAFLAAGTRGPGSFDVRPLRSQRSGRSMVDGASSSSSVETSKIDRDD
jgi:hypothetical protein